MITGLLTVEFKGSLSGPLALVDALKFLRNNKAMAEHSQTERRGLAARRLLVRFQWPSSEST